MMACASVSLKRSSSLDVSFARVLHTAVPRLIDRPKPPPLINYSKEEQAAIAQAVIVTDDVSWTLDASPAATPPPAPPEEASDAATTSDAAEPCDPSPSPSPSPPQGLGAGSGSGSGGGSLEEKSSGAPGPPPTPLVGRRRPLKLVGGVDISFVKGSHENACASLVVLEFPSLETVYEAYERVTMGYPYISGFLAFREVQKVLSYGW